MKHKPEEESIDLNKIGPPVYNLPMEDLFLDVEKRTINYDLFQPYFDQIQLPRKLAQQCLGESLINGNSLPMDSKFGKFLRLDTLQRFDRFPAYHEVKDELVDFKDIEKFRLQGKLSWWGGDDILLDSPCIFVSHRWKSLEHPDPAGSQLKDLVKRLEKMEAKETYLWIDFCCLPQARQNIFSEEDAEVFKLGLSTLPEIVKSCDLIILHAEDYISRAWCYVELFVWLCKVREVGFMHNDEESKLFRSIQTKHLVSTSGKSNGATFDDAIMANVVYRGFNGETSDLEELYNPIKAYCHAMEDSANYHIKGGSPFFDQEYLPAIVGFMCRLWYLLRRKKVTEAEDTAICLRIVMEALKYQ